MPLVGYLRLLRRRWWIVLLAVVVCLGGALAQYLLTTARFESSTRLLVSGASSIGAADETIRRQLAVQRATAFSQLAGTTPVIEAAVAAAGAAHPGDGVAGSAPEVSTAATGSDAFFTITVHANSARAAQDIAAAFPGVLPQQLVRLDQLGSVTDAALTVVSPALEPARPYSPDPIRTGIVGLVLGLVLGALAALVRETLDTTLHDSDEVRRLFAAPVLGVVPREFDNEPLPAVSRANSRRSESYRQIRTNLEFAAGDRPPRSMTFTSPGQGEGKSTTVANLALMYSRAGKRVVVVDADLRRPALGALLGVRSETGLSDVLTGRKSAAEVTQQVADETLFVIAAGPATSNPSELLGSVAMRSLLGELIDGYDLVMVDTPPVLAVTDSLLAGVHTDGFVLLARMRSTTRSALRRSIEAVSRVQGRLLGVVVNAAVEAEDKRYGYGYGYLSTGATRTDAAGTAAGTSSAALTATAAPAAGPAADTVGPAAEAAADTAVPRVRAPGFGRHAD